MQRLKSARIYCAHLSEYALIATQRQKEERERVSSFYIGQPRTEFILILVVVFVHPHGVSVLHQEHTHVVTQLSERVSNMCSNVRIANLLRILCLL